MADKQVECGGKTYAVTERNGRLVVTEGSYNWGAPIATVNDEKEAFNAIKAHSGSDNIKIG